MLAVSGQVATFYTARNEMGRSPFLVVPTVTTKPVFPFYIISYAVQLYEGIQLIFVIKY